MERIPNRLYIDLTTRCNQRCRHCSIAAGRETSALLQDGEIAGLLSEAAGMGITRIVFSGGEPMLRPGLRELVEHAAGLGQSVTILTNGTLLDAPAARLLARYGVSVKISLDGATAATHDALRGRGAFAGAMRGFRTLQLLPPELRSAHFTVHRRNVIELPCVPAVLERAGVRNLVVSTVKPAGRAAINRELLIPPAMIPYVYRRIELLKRDPRVEIREFSSKGWTGFGCPAVCDKFGIAADGSATTCVFLGNDYLGGNVREEPLAALWRRYLSGEPAFAANPTCAACPWLPVTGGGCRARALHFTGDINGPDPYCCAMREHRERLDRLGAGIDPGGAGCAS
jgi:radical SAM protein with 4Fe4S-binding SPASM domain